jgi:hypothetical protein
MKDKLKGILLAAAKGVLKVADKGLIGGVMHNVIEETAVSETGSFDLSKFTRTLIGSTIPVLLLISLLAGWVTMDELKDLIKLFGV